MTPIIQEFKQALDMEILSVHSLKNLSSINEKNHTISNACELIEDYESDLIDQSAFIGGDVEMTQFSMQ